MTENYLTMKTCPKFESCSVNICPLWDNVLNVAQLDNEPTCQFCRDCSRGEVDKIPENLRESIVEIYPKMLEKCGHAFRKKMARSASRSLWPSSNLSNRVLPDTIPNECLI